MMRLLDHPDLCQPQALARWIRARIDEGLSVFDHADIYGDGQCERIFGEALASDPGLQREIRVITKAGIVPAHLDASRWGTKHYRAEAHYLTDAIDSALSRLQVEQIDTFLIHRPDPLMAADRVAQALERAVAAGKVRQIGVSNFLPDQWRWLQRHTNLPLICNQCELSLAHTAPLFDGTLEAHLADNLRWLAWSPLGGGALGQAIPDTLMKAAGQETGLCETGLAIAWLRQLPGRPVPVLGSLRAARIQGALEGARKDLPRPLWYALLEAVRDQAVP
ncbi:aldo/keto reductase [Marinobacter sp. CAU 1620]|nr:aldo/keto reductase [Marinobacter arenosus]